MTEGSVKQVKVDNWGIFFLQRLQQFFNRSEYCDLILQFSNNDQVKVHRLVLNACTEYFQTLEKQGCNVGACIIQMPSDLHSEVVVPIINFMYTGRLEFRPELHSQLYTAAQQMNMTVLTKLLDAQAMNPSAQMKPVIVKKPLPVTWNLQGKKIIPKPDPDLPDPLPGRKLPIWKRRCVPTIPTYSADTCIVNSHDGPSRILLPKPDEAPRPTRFEWPEDDLQPTTFSSSFDDISYESKPLVKAVDHPKCQLQPPEPVRAAILIPTKFESKPVSFEEIRRTAVSIKRPCLSIAEPSESKKLKIVDIQAVKEYIEEHKLRKDLVDLEENSEDVDDDVAVADMDDDDDDDVEDESETPDGVLSGPSPAVNTPKPILKTQSSVEEPPVAVPSGTSSPSMASKKVRFSLDDKSVEGKENDDKEAVKLPMGRATTVSVSTATSETGNLSNHAKIISEVLKKYPHLVKNNKNIRLKIVQRGSQLVVPPAMTEPERQMVKCKSKVSYVVLKSDVAGKGKAVVLKHGGHVEPLSELASQQKTSSGAENITGPWLCYTCGTNDEPMNFETYYQYRRHLQDVHMEKIDARICEHCGHRASKRNLLLYHLYTRHNIPPPRNCQFPKCDQCDYVALSESLLIKHRNNHSNNKEFVCKVCNATFKSNGALQGHMQTNLHSDPAKKLYECPYCMKPFIRNINLKAHLRTAHKEFRKMDEGSVGQLDEQGLPLPVDSEDGDSQPETTGEDSLSSPDVSQVMEVPVLNSVPQVKTNSSGTVMIAPGMTVLAEAPTMQALVPSSEAEALSNVASGIAASLGLADTLTGEQTVIVLDENQEFILHTTEVVREETTFTEVQEYVEETPRSDDQEYIVPEMLAEEQYVGEIPIMDQYSENTEAHTSAGAVENCALTTETETSTTPVTLPTATMEGEEIAMVLSDHDYAEDATPKETSGEESMMFIITQPVMEQAIIDNAKPITRPVLEQAIIDSAKPITRTVLAQAIIDSAKPRAQPILEQAIIDSAKPITRPLLAQAIIDSAKPITRPVLAHAIIDSAKPIPQHVLEQAVNDSAKPMAQPVLEQAIIKSAKPITQPVLEQTVKDSAKPMAEPVLVQAIIKSAKPITQPVLKQTVKDSAKPVAQPALEQAIIISAKPITQPGLEQTVKDSAKPMARPVLEQAIIDSVKPSPQPVMQQVIIDSVKRNTLPVIEQPSIGSVKPVTEHSVVEDTEPVETRVVNVASGPIPKPVSNAQADVKLPLTSPPTNIAASVEVSEDKVCERRGNVSKDSDLKQCKVQNNPSETTRPSAPEGNIILSEETPTGVIPPSISKIIVIRPQSPPGIVCSPKKETIPVSTVPVRRMPAVEMADLVKEWDDFEDDSCDEKTRDSLGEKA